jgi:hypothetical protein
MGYIVATQPGENTPVTSDHPIRIDLPLELGIAASHAIAHNAQLG